MHTYLTIDHGNTRTKASLWVGNRCVHTVLADPGRLAPLLVMAGCAPRPLTVVSCAVRSLDPAYLSALKKLADCFVEVGPSTPMPVTIGYSSPQTLGPDRIAAAVGARMVRPDGELLVADLGTAATYDRVTADGCFIGGNIAPGVGMRLRALNSFTDRLPLLDIDADHYSRFGNDTRSALLSGAIYGVVAELTYYASQLAPGGRVIVTGGDATLIAERCDFEPIVVPDLVQRGLLAIGRHLLHE